MEKNLPRLAFREVHNLGDGRIEDRARAFDFLTEEGLPQHRRARRWRRRRTRVDDPARPLDSISQSPSTLRGTPWTLTPKAKRTRSDRAMSSLLS